MAPIINISYHYIQVVPQMFIDYTIIDINFLLKLNKLIFSPSPITSSSPLHNMSLEIHSSQEQQADRCDLLLHEICMYIHYGECAYILPICFHYYT